GTRPVRHNGVRPGPRHPRPAREGARGLHVPQPPAGGLVLGPRRAGRSRPRRRAARAARCRADRGGLRGDVGPRAPDVVRLPRARRGDDPGGPRAVTASADILRKRGEYDADQAYFDLLLEWQLTGRWRPRVEGILRE